MTDCAGCCEDVGCECEKECDEGRYCFCHEVEVDAEMNAFFGRNPAAMRPVETIGDGEWAEWRGLKQ